LTARLRDVGNCFSVKTKREVTARYRCLFLSLFLSLSLPLFSSLRMYSSLESVSMWSAFYAQGLNDRWALTSRSSVFSLQCATRITRIYSWRFVHMHVCSMQCECQCTKTRAYFGALPWPSRCISVFATLDEDNLGTICISRMRIFTETSHVLRWRFFSS